ncbi:Hypothetical predicted protein [Olea europaea subsp. europaea]|uniref:Uncharacterized protein n=1 Tax=Olea europaea subsp. europaea TaxID=158383 RepID=A0A8S0VA62_OLEEU|nr:Hypothetical predicted protein [Olea europaea subsp. europaea]
MGVDRPIQYVNVWAISREPAFRPERFLEEDFDMKGRDFRLLPFGVGRRVFPGAQLGINFVAFMLGHLLHHCHWALPIGMTAEEIDVRENPGQVTYMRTPLQSVPTPRLPADLYKRVAVDI